LLLFRRYLYPFSLLCRVFHAVTSIALMPVDLKTYFRFYFLFLIKTRFELLLFPPFLFVKNDDEQFQRETLSKVFLQFNFFYKELITMICIVLVVLY